MLFSATMTKKVAKLQRASLKDPVKVRRQISCVLVQDSTSDKSLAFIIQSIKNNSHLTAPACVEKSTVYVA
jgi:superfamily II DNA/RNA helicase